jgi:hypothetical protein
MTRQADRENNKTNLSTLISNDKPILKVSKTGAMKENTSITQDDAPILQSVAEYLYVRRGATRVGDGAKILSGGHLGVPGTSADATSTMVITGATCTRVPADAAIS